MENTEEFFKSLSDSIQEEVDVKIKEAIQLFIKSPQKAKDSFLKGTGFSGELNAERLREHLDYLDLIDEIENAIGYFKRYAELNAP